MFKKIVNKLSTTRKTV